MNVAATQVLSPAETVLAYHARTKHSLKRYAAGPETLDWDTQPNPFREFVGCARTELELGADRLATSFAQACTPGHVDPVALTFETVGQLLELSLGLSAWKEYGPDRWALRCNPSSGNLHPTEAYILSRNVPGIIDGLHHYLSRDHVLELRCQSSSRTKAPARLWIGLSSVQWREAWKYGERAFRYCQLDVGHALGALRYAAGALGWRTALVENLGSAELAALMGLDRADAFSGVEAEDPELLIAIEAAPSTTTTAERGVPGAGESGGNQWVGRANLLDPHPLYRWPVIDQVSQATRGRGTGASSDFPNYPQLQHSSEARAVDIIKGRRSAQRFDSKFKMSADIFYRILDGLLDRPNAPWDVWNFAPRIHPIFFVHRVKGLEPGVYALPRHPAAAHALREQLRGDFEWETPENTPPHLPFVRLLRTDCRIVARAMNCHQAIASDSCFALSMLSEFEPVVRANAWRYRQLHWEAGLLGHVLYLEAEAAGLRGTGIGCYFDDALHEILGITDTQFQALYHFTVGCPLTDDRISTLPAYPGRQNTSAQENTAMRSCTPFQCIDVQRAEALFARSDLVVLDVRDAGSFDQLHIDGAQHVTSANLSAVLGATAKNRPILIYCYHGNASREYALIFSDFGFSEVYSLDGGYEAWRTRPPASGTTTLDPELQQWLVAQQFPSADVKAVIANATTPLMKASHIGDGNIARLLIAAGAEVNARNADGNSALWLACVGGHLEMIDTLVETGIDIDNRNDNGATPLMYAASSGKAVVVERLLAKGADVTPETLDGFSALDLAQTIECLRLLRPRRRLSAASEP